MKFHRIISQLLVVALVTVLSLAVNPDLEKCQQDGYNPCTCSSNYDDNYMDVVCDQVPSSELESVFSKNHDLSIHISFLSVRLGIDSTVPSSLLSIQANFDTISIVCSEFDSLLKMPGISVSDTNQMNTAVSSFEIKDCHLNSIPDLTFLRNFPKLKNVTLYNCSSTDQIVNSITKLNFDVIVQNSNLISNTVFTDKKNHCKQSREGYYSFTITCNGVDYSNVRGDLETLFHKPGLLSNVYYIYDGLEIDAPKVQSSTVPDNMIPTWVKFNTIFLTCDPEGDTKIVIPANAFNIANWGIYGRSIRIKYCDVSQVNWAFLRNVPNDLYLTIESQDGKTKGVDEIFEMKDNEVNDFIKRGGEVIIDSKTVGEVNNN